MNPRKGITLALLVLSMLSLSTFATASIRQAAATYGSTPGPRMDLTIKAYTDPGVEYLGLQGGDIDIMDWPLDQNQINSALADASHSIGLFGFSETGMFQADINKFCDASNPPFHGDILQYSNATGVYCGLDPITGLPQPGFDFPRKIRTTELIDPGFGVNLSLWTSSLNFRKALAHLRLDVEAAIVTGVTQAKQLNSQVPADVAGGASDILNNTLNYNQYNGGRLAAHNLLEAIGLTCTAWNGGTLQCGGGTGTGADCLLDTTVGGSPCMTPLHFSYRSDDPRRTLAAQLLTTELQKVGINVGLIARSSPNTRVPVFRNSAFNMYTGGWIFIIDPDYVWDLYTKGGIFPVGTTSLNYGLNVDPLTFDLASKPKFGAASTPPAPYQGAPTGCPEADGNAAGVQCGFAQTLARMAARVVTLPFYGNTAVNGVRKPYWVGTNQNAPTTTQGVINANAIGPGASLWGFLNGYSTSPSIRWGFKSPMVDPNPVTSEWLWDAQLLGAIYDSGLTRETYDLLTWRSWIYSPASLNAGTWAGTLVSADYPSSGTSFTGGGSSVHFNIQTGIDLGGGLGNAIRFQPHPALTLPGPDNTYGTGDDVAVPAQTNGKVLDGFDVKASIEYVIDHVGFNYASVADVIDVTVCDSSNANCVQPGADGILFTADDTLAATGNARHVDVYFLSTSWLARNFIGGVTIVPSDIWSTHGTPGNPADDAIPNPTQFSARDPNNDGNQADHVLYGSGAWSFSSSFDITVGGTLPRNTHYFTPARTPIDPDVDGVQSITVPNTTTKATGVDIGDVQAAGLQFSTSGAYQVRYDANYDRKTDLDDLLITTAYFQFGVNPSNPTLTNAFRTWPDTGAG